MEGTTNIKNLESTTRIENLENAMGIENLEGVIRTENCTIGSKINFLLSTKIQDSKRKNKIPNLAKL